MIFSSKRTIAVFGATGSIGTQTMSVIEQYKESFEIVLLTAHTNLDKVSQLAQMFHVNTIGLHNETILETTKSQSGVTILYGRTALADFFIQHPVHTLVFGTNGIEDYSLLKAVYPYVKRICIASKEIIVIAGMTGLLQKIQATCEVLPIDSEHAAIHQLLSHASMEEIDQVILTASGGPFYSQNDSATLDFSSITPEEALQHPTWKMGKKVTIDSASMANKGIELLEAHYLFELPPERLSVVIHPQSIIHAMVAWKNGTVFSQNSWPDMRLPISYALFYPHKFPILLEKKLPFYLCNSDLQLRKVDPTRISTISLAYQAMHAGGILPMLYLIADEIAVEAFLDTKLSFLHIATVIEYTLNHYGSLCCNLEDPISQYKMLKNTLQKNLKFLFIS